MTESMDLYMVMDNSAHNNIGLDDYKNESLNLLVQFHKKEYARLRGFKRTNILIDSGAFAFNFYGQSQSTEKTYKFIDKYIRFIKKTERDRRIVGYFDMDLIYTGLENIRRLRNNLKNYTSKVIAVYHPVYGLDEFKRMCFENRYVSICSLDGITPKGYDQMVKYAHKHNCLIHGLGINDNRILRKVPFDSADSAIWELNGIYEYYYNSSIPKNAQNNKKCRPLFTKKAFLEQIQRQNYYNEYWQTYFDLKKTKKVDK